MMNPIRSEGELFKKILGEKWTQLYPDIQRRFDKNPMPSKPLRYTGIMRELSCSFWGKMLGHVSMPLIKGALIPYTAHDFPVDIEVFSKEDCPHIFKYRIYKLPNRKHIEFTSYMKESKKGDVLEYVGFGLGMKLLVSVKDHNLHFRSDGYFWDVGLFRIPIPDVLSPGLTTLTHFNESADSFSIRIDIDHKVFGKMFVQAGRFREVHDE